MKTYTLTCCSTTCTYPSNTGCGVVLYPDLGTEAKLVNNKKKKRNIKKERKKCTCKKTQVYRQETKKIRKRKSKFNVTKESEGCAANCVISVAQN